MIKVYRKMGTIKAEQFDGSNAMVKKYHIEYDEAYVLPFRIETLEGWLGIKTYDWIATGVNGEHWAIRDDVFKQKYDELPVIPVFVADYIDYCKRDIPHSPSRIGVGSAMQPEYMGVCMPDEVDMWLADNDLDTNVKHEELFARAWLDGFQTED